MSSKKTPDLPRLEEDLPTTEADVEALRRASRASRASRDLGAVLAFLSRFPAARETLQKRGTHEGFEPFEL